ncbi:DUF1642 domain-containing protein [Lactococcus garvieae]|uniref:DUF1642 domain-containing protein n=3 Tax=Lactococcus garvieae TaxID=1363 RepID=UPI00031858AC|nr:DUF1642 domain-containing protein [Lactococcus garvieae]
MKKFEEEVKRPSNAGIDPFSKRDVSFEKLSSKFTKGAQTLKEWKEYAFKAEDRIRELESQLEKHQPEIPEFMANYIEAAKEDFWTLLSAMDDSNLSSRVGDWLKGGNFTNQEIFAQAWLNGYTVAKEKRFYLKNKLTGLNLVEEKTFSLTGKHVGERFREFECNIFLLMIKKLDYIKTPSLSKKSTPWPQVLMKKLRCKNEREKILCGIEKFN